MLHDSYSLCLCFELPTLFCGSLQEEKGSAPGSGGGGIRMGRLRSAGQRSSSFTGGSKLAAAGGGAAGYGDADVAKLKEAIQTLCQSTHPLGEWSFPQEGGDI